MNDVDQKIERDLIAEQTEDFIRNGGKIEKLAGYGLQSGVIDTIQKGREKLKTEKTKKRIVYKKSILAAQARKALKTARASYLSVRDGVFYVRSKEMIDGKLIQKFESVNQVNGFDFGKVIDEYKS